MPPSWEPAELTARRLRELRSAEPGDATLRALVEVLEASLAWSARLPALGYRAEYERDLGTAEALRRVAALEQRILRLLLDALDERLSGP